MTPPFQRTHADFVALIRSLIAGRRYEDVFSRGCCFHFALRAARRSIGTPAYTQASLNPAKKGHVFVIAPDGRAFDHKGYRPVSDLKKEFCEWGDEAHFFASEAEIEQDIAKRPLPDDLTAAVFALADEIIETRVHESRAQGNGA